MIHFLKMGCNPHPLGCQRVRKKGILIKIKDKKYKMNDNILYKTDLEHYLCLLFMLYKRSKCILKGQRKHTLFILYKANNNSFLLNDNKKFCNAVLFKNIHIHTKHCLTRQHKLPDLFGLVMWLCECNRISWFKPEEDLLCLIIL